MEQPGPGFPMFYENNPNTISDQIVWLVKHSQLNFQIQETAYSLTIQIKKRFLDKWSESHQINNLAIPPLQEQLTLLKIQNDALEKKLREALKIHDEENNNFKQEAKLAENKVKAFQAEREVFLSEINILTRQFSEDNEDSSELPVKKKKPRKKKKEN